MLCFFCVQSVSATIDVSQPVTAPTNLTATLQVGGSLDASTTYYFVVFAYDTEYMTPMTQATRLGYHSEISMEGTFTTNSTHRSALIQFTNSAEHTADTRYVILLSKTSGDYASARSTVGVNHNERARLISDGTAGYVVSVNPTWAFGYHTIQSLNDLPFGMNKSTGIIKVYVDDETLTSGGIWSYRYALQRIYEEVVSAGYADNIYWDGYHFALKGFIIIDGTSTTSMNIRNVVLYFIKGGLRISNPNADIQFGNYVDDYAKASYPHGCTIHLLNARYPFFSTQEGTLKLYGCRVTLGSEGMPNTVADVNSMVYYTAGGNMNLIYKVDEVKDTMLVSGASIRNANSVVKDLKFGIGNNWHNTDSYRLTIIQNRMFAYSLNARIYATTFALSLAGSNSLRMYVPGSGLTYSTHMYDPMFPLYDDNLPPVWYYNTNYGKVTSDSYIQVYYTVDLTVMDSDGNLIEDAVVNMTDRYGDSVLWVEHDHSFDRTITGNTFETSRLTDSDGRLDYYVRAYRINLHPNNTIANAYCDNIVKTDYYPLTLTISKPGYQDSVVVISNHTNKFISIVGLLDEVNCTSGFRGYIVEYASIPGFETMLTITVLLGVCILYKKRKERE